MPDEGHEDSFATAALRNRRDGPWPLIGLGVVAIALVTLTALLLVGAAVVASTFNVHLGNGVGDRTYVVGGTQDLRGSYKLGIGEMILDLRNVPFTKAETHVKARVDIGSLRVIVPRDVALQVRGDAHLGEVHIVGRSD